MPQLDLLDMGPAPRRPPPPSTPRRPLPERGPERRPVPPAAPGPVQAPQPIPAPAPKPVKIDYAARRCAFDEAVAEALLHYDRGPGPRVPTPEWLAASRRAMELGRMLPWYPMGWLFGEPPVWPESPLKRF